MSAITLTPVLYSNLTVGKTYLRTPDCSVLFVVEERASDKLAVLVGRILNAKDHGTNNFDLKRIQSKDDGQFYEFQTFPLLAQFRNKLKDAGKYYEKALTVVNKEGSKILDQDISELLPHVIDTLGTCILSSLQHRAVGRSFLVVDSVPVDKYEYVGNPWEDFYIIATDGKNSFYPAKDRPFGHSVGVSPVKISSKFGDLPITSLNKNKWLIDVLNCKAADFFEHEENSLIFKALIELSQKDELTIKRDEDCCLKKQIRSLFQILESRGFCGTKVAVHPSEISNFGSLGDVFKLSSAQERVRNIWGHLWTSEVYVSTDIPVGTILVADCELGIGNFVPTKLPTVDFETSKITLDFRFSEAFILALYPGRCAVLFS